MKKAAEEVHWPISNDVRDGAAEEEGAAAREGVYRDGPEKSCQDMGLEVLVEPATSFKDGSRATKVTTLADLPRDQTWSKAQLRRHGGNRHYHQSGEEAPHLRDARDAGDNDGCSPPQTSDIWLENGVIDHNQRLGGSDCDIRFQAFGRRHACKLGFPRNSI